MVERVWAAVGRRGVLAGAAGTAGALLVAPALAQQPVARRVSYGPNSPLDRALTGPGKTTTYRMDSVPPHPDLEDWPGGIKADCSGFVAWCMRLNRYPPQLRGEQLSTRSIYQDAIKTDGNLFFSKVASPIPEGIVVYPDYMDLAGAKHVGHVALIAAVRGRFDYDIVDCSESGGKAGDAVARAMDAKFETHRALVNQVRKERPSTPEDRTREPIFAKLIW